jgi:hypothetical protein
MLHSIAWLFGLLSTCQVTTNNSYFLFVYYYEPDRDEIGDTTRVVLVNDDGDTVVDRRDRDAMRKVHFYSYASFHVAMFAILLVGFGFVCCLFGLVMSCLCQYHVGVVTVADDVDVVDVVVVVVATVAAVVGCYLNNFIVGTRIQQLLGRCCHMCRCVAIHASNLQNLSTQSMDTLNKQTNKQTNKYSMRSWI